jgi:hypothetical protein
MARSTRRNPFCGNTTARSEKWNKRFANRAQRAAVRSAMATGREIPDRRETSDVWGMEKDGKQRFDPAQHPDIWRK